MRTHCIAFGLFIVSASLYAQQSQQVQAPPPAPQVVTPAPPAPVSDGKLRVFVTDNPTDVTTYTELRRGGGVAHVSPSGQTVYAGGAGATAGESRHTTEDPRTVEIQADMVKFCPANVVVTNDLTRADFILVFRRREGARSLGFAGGGLVGLAALSGAKVDGASLFDRTGDMVFATKQRTVEKTIQEICTRVR